MTAIHLTDGRHLGRLLRRLRHDAGLSQGQLAERLHITKNAASKRELTSRALPAAALIEAVDALDHDVLIVPRARRRSTGTGWPT